MLESLSSPSCQSLIRPEGSLDLKLDKRRLGCASHSLSNAGEWTCSSQLSTRRVVFECVSIEEDSVKRKRTRLWDLQTLRDESSRLRKPVERVERVGRVRRDTRTADMRNTVKPTSARRHVILAAGTASRERSHASDAALIMVKLALHHSCSSGVLSRCVMVAEACYVWSVWSVERLVGLHLAMS